MTQQWQPGTTYITGSIVVPTSTPPPGITALLNPNFATGDTTGWTANAGNPTWTASAGGYSGNKVTAIGGGIGTLKNNAVSPCSPGQTMSAQCMARLTNAGGVDDLGAEIALYWTDASHAFISQVEGANIHGVGGSWKQITVSGVAPANAAFVQVVLGANTGSHGGNIDFSVVTWNSSYNGPPAGLVYKATQAAPGKSGATEPTWPGNTTTPVTDNQVTWQGIIATQLVWTASPINKSGATEPAWATQPGGAVNDNGIDWVATVPVVTDSKWPATKYTAIAASKIYKADNDIVSYSATANPLDWSSTNDAGYLPFGLQTYGDNPAAAMGLYRSNLIVFSASGFQMWQVDEDPANSALMDSLPIASTWNTALTPVANDLLFLSSKGVRSVGIAATGVNLQAGDVGMPIDPLVQLALANAIANPSLGRILSFFIPAEAQYWLAFSNYPNDTINVTGDMGDGPLGKVIAGRYTISGGTPPYAVTLNSGQLPVGVTLNADGSYAGIYETSGAYSWQIKVVDSTGIIALKGDSANVGIMTISGDLGDGRSGTVVAYAYTSTGGAGTVTFSVASGTFPPGLTLNPDGTVTGTRTTQGTYNFTVRAQDIFANHADLPDTSVTGAPWNWQFIPQTALPTQPARIAPVVFDPVTGLGIMSDDTTGNVYVSSDGGATWVSKTTGYNSGSGARVVAASKGALMVFASGSMKRSTDGGNTWATVALVGVDQAISTPDYCFVYGFTLGGARFSADGGATWGTPTSLPAGFNLGDSGLQFGGLFISQWNTWIAPGQDIIYECAQTIPNVWTQPATGINRVGVTAYSPLADTAVVGADTGIYYRTRTGSWTFVSFGVGTAGGVAYCPPLGQFVLYNSASLVYTSPDGITWTPHTTTGLSGTGGVMAWSPVANQLFIPGQQSPSYFPYLSNI